MCKTSLWSGRDWKWNRSTAGQRKQKRHGTWFQVRGAAGPTSTFRLHKGYPWFAVITLLANLSPCQFLSSFQSKSRDLKREKIFFSMVLFYEEISWKFNSTITSLIRAEFYSLSAVARRKKNRNLIWHHPNGSCHWSETVNWPKQQRAGCIFSQLMIMFHWDRVTVHVWNWIPWRAFKDIFQPVCITDPCCNPWQMDEARWSPRTSPLSEHAKLTAAQTYAGQII